MEKITSLQNNLIKTVLQLRESNQRRQQGMTIIDGPREIERALEAGIGIDKIFYVQGQQENLLKSLLDKKVKAIEVTAKILEKLAYGQRHEGILAVVKTPAVSFKDLKLSSNAMVVVLESLEKPGNLGAILRTCDAVGVEAVFVCDPLTDVFNPNVIRSSTGMVFKIPVVCASSEEILAYLKAKNIKIIAAAPLAQQVYTQADFRKAWALALGREDKGLSSFWLLAADNQVKIPMKGQADSLNVSISAAIILYEALRQRHL